jgi:cytochrome c-type biogenesis protein
MGASTSALAGFLTNNTRVLTLLAGAALIFFGLHAMGLFNIGFFNYEKRFSISKFKPKHAGAFLMGAVFALGWSPCIGPILAGFLAMAAAQDTALKGCLLLFVFSLGLGTPFIISGFAVGKLFTIMAKYRKFVRYTEILAGALLTLIGIALILSSHVTSLSRFLPV